MGTYYHLYIFQSTLPAGEATIQSRFLWTFLYDFNPRFPRGKRLHLDSDGLEKNIDFNPRFPRGKRQHNITAYRPLKGISIHASRGGSDPFSYRGQWLQLQFQSTLPAGEATLSTDKKKKILDISIHASRGGSDFALCRPLLNV